MSAAGLALARPRPRPRYLGEDKAPAPMLRERLAFPWTVVLTIFYFLLIPLLLLGQLIILEGHNYVFERIAVTHL